MPQWEYAEISANSNYTKNPRVNLISYDWKVSLTKWCDDGTETLDTLDIDNKSYWVEDIIPDDFDMNNSVHIQSLDEVLSFQLFGLRHVMSIMVAKAGLNGWEFFQSTVTKVDFKNENLEIIHQITVPQYLLKRML